MPEMSTHDLVRVFKGVGLVVDHLVVMNKTGMRDKIARAQFHASELMKVAFEIRNDMSNGSESSSQQSHQYSPPNVDDLHASERPPSSHAAPSPAVHVPVAPFTVPAAAAVHHVVPPFNASPAHHVAPPFTAPIVVPTIVQTAAHASPVAQPVVPAHVAAAAFVPMEPEISIPISLKDFTAMSGQPAAPLKNEKPEDLIGFEPPVKTASAGVKGGARDGNTVINGVKTSSMRERAVPATQLVSA